MKNNNMNVWTGKWTPRRVEKLKFLCLKYKVTNDDIADKFPGIKGKTMTHQNVSAALNLKIHNEEILNEAERQVEEKKRKKT